MKMPFGRFRGLPVSSLPTDYLWWLVRLDDLRDPLRSAAWDALRRRDPAPGASKPPATIPDQALAERLIGEGRRALARKHHPDIGGDGPTMARVNETAQALRALVRTGSA